MSLQFVPSTRFVVRLVWLQQKLCMASCDLFTNVVQGYFRGILAVVV